MASHILIITDDKHVIRAAHNLQVRSQDLIAKAHIDRVLDELPEGWDAQTIPNSGITGILGLLRGGV